MKKRFILTIPIDYIGKIVGSVVVKYVVYLYVDGTMRTIDIDEVLFNDKDIADYVSAAQPDLWDEWLEAGENDWKAKHEEPTPVEHDDHSVGEGYLHTNI
jgi:hypothetical protein